MTTITTRPQKMILDLGKLGELNSQKGNAGKFCLGDTVVLACGAWKERGLFFRYPVQFFPETDRAEYFQRR